MAEILSINGAEVKIGEDDGKVVTTPIASLQFSNPKVGDKVDVYRDGKTSSSSAPKVLLVLLLTANVPSTNISLSGLELSCLAVSVLIVLCAVKLALVCSNFCFALLGGLLSLAVLLAGFGLWLTGLMAWSRLTAVPTATKRTSRSTKTATTPNNFRGTQYGGKISHCWAQWLRRHHSSN